MTELSEAGRVLSAANANALVAAWRTLGAILTRALGATPADDDDAEGTSESIREALSHNDVARALEMALRAAHPATVDGYWLWVQDVFPDSVVYRWETPAGVALYRRDYTIGEDGASVQLGDPIEVAQRTEYVPVAQATEAADVRSDLVPLLERAVRDDGTVPLRIIAPGWGSSGYYSADVLERDGPRVFTSGLHMYLDHPSESESVDRPERSVRDLAGRLTTDARWDPDGPAGPGLYAEAEVFGPFRDVLDQIAPHIGVSIRAAGMVSEGEAEGRAGRLVDSLVQAESVDWVTRAGAGGQVVMMLESARSRSGQVPASSVAQVGEPAAAEIVAPIAESEGDDMELTERIAELEAQLAEARQARATDAARALVAERLADADLPAFATRRITDALVADVPVTESGELDQDALTAAIDAAVQEWRADLAGMTEAGTGVENVGPIGGGESDEQLETALAGVFGAFGLTESARQIAVRGR